MIADGILSGVRGPARDVIRVEAEGLDAILVGESPMEIRDPARLLQEFSERCQKSDRRRRPKTA